MTINDIEFELHTHTIASGHAYATITEMAKEASEKGLKAIGIADHAPAIAGGVSEIYFRNLKVLPSTLYGIDVLFGSEINCIDYDGGLDLPDDIIKTLAIRLVGMHQPALFPGDISQNTKALINICHNPLIDCIVHPDDSRYPLDYEPLIKAAKETDTLIEVNNNSLRSNWKINVRENILTYLKLCKKYDNKIVLSSDAHFVNDIKNLQAAIDIVEEVGIKASNVLNYDYECFKEFIKNKRKKENK